MLLNGALTGPGDYVDKNGNKFVEAWFYKDKKHGMTRVEHANGEVTVATLYYGLYHGPKTFYKLNGTIWNQLNIDNKMTWNDAVELKDAFFHKDGSAQFPNGVVRPGDKK